MPSGTMEATFHANDVRKLLVEVERDLTELRKKVTKEGGNDVSVKVRVTQSVWSHCAPEPRAPRSTQCVTTF